MNTQTEPKPTVGADPLGPLETALARAPVWALAVAALALIQLTLIWSHEAWADEYQAVLLATEASSQAELFAWLRYEGHPPAWYWLLQALGAALPFALILPVAATVCAVVLQGAILFAAPFTRAERLLLASSQYALFEFLTISRGASLGAALMTLALVLWRSRWLWLIMTILPLVDFLFGVISGVFLILKWREGEIWWPGVAAWLGGSMLAGWSVLPAADMVSASEAMAMESSAFSWFLKMGSLPFPFQGGIAPQWNTPTAPIAGFAWIITLGLAWCLTQGFTWHRLMIFGFFGFTLAFSLVIYPIGLRHLMLGSWLLIALVWLQRGEAHQSAPLAQKVWPLWLVALTVSGLATASLSTTRGFDSADTVIAEIERRGLAGKRWVALPEWRVPAVAGRSDIAFARLGEDCTFRFVRWDHAYSALASPEAFTAALEADITANGRGYLLSDMDFDGFDADLIAPVASIGRGYNGIDYRIYVIGRNTTEKPNKLPSCHAVSKQSPAANSLGKK
ncbi:MAG: hypothetical protein HRT64_03285 [Erythrobacter sp.]|nr:hypothetical protein [Erythrobacter sp.]